MKNLVNYFKILLKQ